MRANEPGQDAEGEPHVFDQTNGVVDLGADDSQRPDGRRDRDRTVSGIAMLSTQKP